MFGSCLFHCQSRFFISSYFFLHVKNATKKDVNAKKKLKENVYENKKEKELS